MTNDFYDIAYDELLYLQHTLNQSSYNPIVAHAQQVAEKSLKSVVNVVSIDDSKSIKTHNLLTLYERLKDLNVDLSLDDLELSYLSDFYFTARYPGNDFVIVNKDKCNRCLNIMYKIIKSVNKFRLENGLSTFNFEEKYTVYAKTSDIKKDVALYCLEHPSDKPTDEYVKYLAEQCPEVYYDEYTTELERAWKTLNILGEV